MDKARFVCWPAGLLFAALTLRH